MKLAVTIMLVSGLALGAAAHEAEHDAVASAEAALGKAAYGDVAALHKARAQFAALSAAEPKSALLHYFVALADWRLVPRMDDDAKKAEQYCTEGIERCERAIALDARFADAIALQAGLQGLSLRFDPGAAMTLGPKMEAAFQRAAALDPTGPRIALLDGINTFHKPSFVGGGAKNAYAKFLAADSLFAREADNAKDGAEPRWGREDAYLWVGRAAMVLDDYPTARRFYLKVLELNPENGWVRGSLLPEAEAKLAGKDES